jgi:ubiquinone/menaquinone biosynthesis C-methylase UbiE
VTEGDAEKMPYPDSIFHAAVSSFGMHHVPRPQVALAECRRVLKPGARLAFTVWATPDQNIAWSLVFDAAVRMAALIAAQEPSALAAMIDDIAGQAERFRRNDHLAIPIAAVLARGRKSTE